MKKETLIPLCSILILGLGGIAAMILAAIYDLEWCKNIAFFVFGMSTSPLYDAARYIKTGEKTKMSDTVKRMMIGGILAGSLSLFSCAGTTANIDRDCVVDASQKCYHEYSKCFEESDTNDNSDSESD